MARRLKTVMMAVPPLRALLCDDEPSSLLAVSVILDRCGFTVVDETSSASAAITVAQRARPDVVVVDLALAGFRGLRVVSALEAAAPGCAVLVVAPFPSLFQAALDAGAYACCTKADLRILEQALHQLGVMPDGNCRCGLN